MASLKKVNRLMLALELSGDDIDGAWSDLDDWYETRGTFSFDDIQRVKRLIDAAIAEQEANAQ